MTKPTTMTIVTVMTIVTKMTTLAIKIIIVKVIGRSSQSHRVPPDRAGPRAAAPAGRGDRPLAPAMRGRQRRGQGHAQGHRRGAVALEANKNQWKMLVEAAKNRDFSWENGGFKPPQLGIS